MKIFIDADGSPVVGITTNIAMEYNIELIIVKNYAHDIYNDYATIISVDIGKDSADQFIVNHAQENDLVITQDYGLAALLLSKQVKVINQNGLIYNNDNIDSLLNRRFLNAKARSQNKRHSNIKKRSSLDDENFSKTLNSIILNEIRND
ncbi:MAG: YaiI/YqxD family protein [Erysipelothrix sp.]|nr:YaiI/YqxD family protein [Erysipelothrix sp.]